MTPGRAALVILMDRYLAGLLDPFVTLLEVHKLMYFMQEAGEPLRLRHVAGPYGPYAENLRHVLQAVEGYCVSGYGGGGDAPDKILQIVPGAVATARASLDAPPGSRARCGRVLVGRTQAAVLSPADPPRAENADGAGLDRQCKRLRLAVERFEQEATQ